MSSNTAFTRAATVPFSTLVTHLTHIHQGGLDHFLGKQNRQLTLGERQRYASGGAERTTCGNEGEQLNHFVLD